MIVEFLEGNAFLNGFILSQGEGKLEVFTQNKTMRIARQRAILMEEAEDPKSDEKRRKILQAKNLLREDLSKEIDLIAAWELLDGEGDNFDYKDLAELIFGKNPSPDQTSAVMRRIHADGLYFKFSPAFAKRNTEEEVARILRQRKEEEARLEENRQALEWLQDLISQRKARAQGGPGPLGAGSVKAQGQAPNLSPSPSPIPDASPQRPEIALRIIAELKELALSGEDSQPPKKRLTDILSKSGLPGDPDGAAEALRAAGVFAEHEDLDLLRLGIPLEFPQEVLDEAERLSESVDYLKENRLDLTGEHVVTIDSEGAQEYDDAVSLSELPDGNLKLGIHIADASWLIKRGSVLDHFASNRGASVYLPEGRLPMLPPILPQKILSLATGEIRPAFSVLLRVSPNGQVLESSFKPSLIRVKEHLSFSEADLILSDEENNTELGNKLKSFYRLGKLFLKKRLDDGGNFFNIPTHQVTIDENGLPEISIRSWDTPASLTVGEIMIIANAAAARTLNDLNFPCPFRYQIVSKAPLVLPSFGSSDREKLAKNLALRRRLGRTGISLEPSRHRGLGLRVYTYFTSPMRRYFDLLTHRQLRAYSLGKGPAYDEKTLMTEAFTADDILRAIHRAQNNRLRYWITFELSGKIGEEFVLLAFERQGKRLRLCLTDYMIEIETFKFPDDIQPGDDVLTTLKVADYRKKTLIFEFKEIVRRGGD